MKAVSVDPLVTCRADLNFATKKEKLKVSTEKFRRQRMVRCENGWFSEVASPYKPVGHVISNNEELVVSGLTEDIGRKVTFV